MKKRLLLFIVSLLGSHAITTAQTYPSLNINLLSHIDPETDNTGYDGRKYSGCWGWYQASTHKEYAIVGTSSKTYFIDVSNPQNPVIKDSVMAAHAGCTWREIKTYQNYCYIVSDDAPPNTFQIVDMQYLPDSVHVVYNNNTYFERCHTIFVDNGHLYCGGPTDAGTAVATESMRVYSLANPAAPVLLRKLAQDIPAISYVHDMFVRNDTVYASCGGQGFFILRFNSAVNTFSLMQSFTGYPYNGYNHSSWQTDNRKTMVFADEVPAGLPAKVIDVSDFNNITLVDTIQSHPRATAHNPYIMNNAYCWMSSYQDGIYLYDISDPANTKIHGYFDTQPEHGVNDNFSTNDYKGNWGAYPYLPSEIIIACDMQNGIFILEGDYDYKVTVGLAETKAKEQASSVFSVYPNPAGDELTLLIANQSNRTLSYRICDVTGKIVAADKLVPDNNLLYKTSIDTKALTSGCYFITVKENGVNETKKIIIQK
jgi:choice-of-anchor B domain-containing protein